MMTIVKPTNTEKGLTIQSNINIDAEKKDQHRDEDDVNIE